MRNALERGVPEWATIFKVRPNERFILKQKSGLIDIFEVSPYEGQVSVRNFNFRINMGSKSQLIIKQDSQIFFFHDGSEDSIIKRIFAEGVGFSKAYVLAFFKVKLK